MNNINVTVQLCAEDRARLDGILEALNGTGRISEALGNMAEVLKQFPHDLATARCLDAAAEGIRNMGKPVKHAPAETAQPTPAAPAEEKPTENKPEPEKPAEAAPAPTEDDLRSLVQKLIAAGKRDAAKAIVQKYAARVGDVPEDKRAEAIDQLHALEV